MPKELKDRMLKVSFKPLRKKRLIESTADCVRFLNIIWDKRLFNLQEQFYVVYLDRNNFILCWRCLNTGSADACTVDVDLLLASAVGCFAKKIIVAHNHTTGYFLPSKEDLTTTKRISEVAQVIGLKLIDHIILASSGHYSFMENGELK